MCIRDRPQELRLIISREVADGEFDLDTLMKVAEREINARERAATTSSSLRRPNKDLPTATAMTSSASAPKCYYCGQLHPSHACERVTDPEERKKILMSSGRCFVCLRKFHRSREYRSTMKCTRCGGKHHVSICLKGCPRSTMTTSAESSTSSSPPSTLTQPGNLPGQTRPPASSVNYVNAKVPILLQTAKAHVYKVGNPQSTMELRVLFDCGSQRSYVTKRVTTSLSLDTEHVETMLIKTFGSENEDKQEYGVVRLGMALRDGTTFEMSLFTVPFICEPLSVQPICLR